MTTQLPRRLTRAAVGAHEQRGTEEAPDITGSSERFPGEGGTEACIRAFQEKGKEQPRLKKKHKGCLGGKKERGEATKSPSSATGSQSAPSQGLSFYSACL